MLSTLLTHTPLLYFVQSLWRDEAFSALAAERSLPFIITSLGFEPPVYYILLHFWILFFGSSEIALRTLSVVAILLTTVVVIEWAADLYKKHWLRWFLPLFFILNPMILYYAFEVRTYAWYTFFATVMLHAYTLKKWKWFVAAAVLGFYTHIYLLPYISTLMLHWLITNRSVLKRSLAWKQEAPRSFAIAIALMAPWLIKVAGELGRMKQSWYFPVDVQLVRSVLGNLFTGYEGTPWYGWKYTAYLSAVIVAASLFSLSDKRNRGRTMLFILFGLLPLALIVGISFVKPLYVNRYLIPTTVAEVFVIVAAIAAIRNQWIQKFAAAAALLGIVWFNWWYPVQNSKPDYRRSFEQINLMAKPDDIILAEHPINYLETLYYANDRSRVYLYNPSNNIFPWYIGDALINPSNMLRDFPDYPARAILVHPDTSFEVVYRLPL